MSEEWSPAGRDGDVDDSPKDAPEANYTSLKYSLLGPSLTKAGQEAVDQSVVSEIIYNASKGSKFFNREEEKDKILTAKIDRILSKKQKLEQLDLTRELRAADNLLAQLELSRDLTQQIVHVDCDAFYASVELLDRPELEDLPFAVGGGILTTCNYVARKFGCRSGMPGFVAKKLCPELVLLPLNFDKYNSKAAEIREVLVEYDPRFESASIDEAYLNITEYCARQGLEPAEAVSKMRQEVHEKTKITGETLVMDVSAGIAANTRIAKICSNMNKPNGQFSVPHDRAAIMEFMATLSCRKVNGIGRVLERELASVGINTCGDIFSHRQYLQQLFGDKTYEFLLRCYLGLGRTSVQPAVEYERKSVGTESTFREIRDPVQLREKLRWTADELEKDMRRAECKGRTLCLKVKLHTFEVLTRQVVPPKAVFLADDLYNYSLPMLTKLEQEFPSLRLRLLGLRCTHLVSTKPPDTATFFGLRPRLPDADGSAILDQGGGGDGEWEQWPEDPLPGHDDPRSGDTPPAPGDVGSGGEEGYRRHGKEITANPQKGESVEKELWDCPICSRPQAADERRFNEHIDLCLSRQAIRDTVQQEGAALSVATTSTTTTPPPSVDKKSKKRTRQPAEADPRQTKLRFG